MKKNSLLQIMVYLGTRNVWLAWTYKFSIKGSLQKEGRFIARWARVATNRGSYRFSWVGKNFRGLFQNGANIIAKRVLTSRTVGFLQRGHFAEEIIRIHIKDTKTIDFKTDRHWSGVAKNSKGSKIGEKRYTLDLFLWKTRTLFLYKMIETHEKRYSLYKTSHTKKCSLNFWTKAKH